MLGGIRRILALFAAVSAATAVVSLVAALAVGSAAVGRALATGFYIVGAFFLLAAVAVGARGPVRPKDAAEREPAMSLFGLGVGFRGLRPATGEERREGVALTALFLALGVALIIFGVVADSAVELV